MMVMHKHQGFAEVNGTRLYYEMAGSGDPLVLIHGNTLNLNMWDDQFWVFSREYQVIRYDMRGFGKSALPTGESYAQADDLMALLHHLGLVHAHVLGLSRGGVVAIDFALTYPKETDTLIVVDTGLRGFQMKEFGAFASQVRSVGKISGIEVARRNWLGGPLLVSALGNPAVAARVKRMVANYSGWHWVNDESLRILDPLPIQQLGTISIPTLIIIGEHDLPDFHAIAETLHQGICHAHKVTIPSVGHMSNMEDPECFNEMVLEFLAGK